MSGECGDDLDDLDDTRAAASSLPPRRKVHKNSSPLDAYSTPERAAMKMKPEKSSENKHVLNLRAKADLTKDVKNTHG